MSKLPPPPVPEKLREMLKDYPELIQEIRDTLDGYAKKPNPLQPFDGALWLLEDTLSTFAVDAREELNAVEGSDDAEAIARARAKAHLMGRARSSSAGGGMCGLDDLWDYFETHKEAFQ